jgi:hypothetical protein
MQDDKELLWSASRKSTVRDYINMASLTIDNSIIALGATVQAFKPGAEAQFNMQASGDIVMKAGEKRHFYAEISQTASVPVAIYSERVIRVIKALNAISTITSDMAKLANDCTSISGQILPIAIEKL